MSESNPQTPQEQDTTVDETRAPRGRALRRVPWIPILVFLVGVAVVSFSVFRYKYPLLDPSQKLQASEPYKIALKAVRNDPLVKKYIGPAIVPTGHVDGSISETECFLDFHLVGTKGRVHVHGKALKDSEQWVFILLELYMNEHKKFSVDSDQYYTGRIVLEMEPGGGPQGRPTWESKEIPRSDKPNLP